MALFARTVVLNTYCKAAALDTGVGFFQKTGVYDSWDSDFLSFFFRMKSVCTENEQNPLCLLLQSNLESMTS